MKIFGTGLILSAGISLVLLLMDEKWSLKWSIIFSSVIMAVSVGAALIQRSERQ